MRTTSTAGRSAAGRGTAAGAEIDAAAAAATPHKLMRMTRRMVRRWPTVPASDEDGSTVTVVLDEGIGDVTRCLYLLDVLACDRVRGVRGGETASRTPQAAPEVELTVQEKQVWAPLPPDRSAVPVLLYHGVGPESDFTDETDASYGIDVDDFAKQMTMIAHAGYQTIDLEYLSALRAGGRGRPAPEAASAHLRRRPSELMDRRRRHPREARLRRGLHVRRRRPRRRRQPRVLDLGRAPDTEGSGRWELQLHSGDGHRQVKYGPGLSYYGPYYAYLEQDEDFDGWQKRVRSDIDWGDDTLSEHSRAYRPLAFSPPYGNYGQDGTNEPRIPEDLLGWLTQRYGLVFTQDRNARAHRGSGQPLGRIQVTR